MGGSGPPERPREELKEAHARLHENDSRVKPHGLINGGLAAVLIRLPECRRALKIDQNTGPLQRVVLWQAIRFG